MNTDNKEKQAVPEEEAKAGTAAEDIKEETKPEEKKDDKKSSKKDKKAEEKKSAEKSAEEKHTAEMAAANDRYLRLYAEYDNYRKRSQKERDSLYGDIKADVLVKFLPVYDNLERALALQCADEAYRRGVEMIMAQFKATMEKLGVTEIESLGKKFDPNLHNAVMHVEDEEKGESEIVEVFQQGFRIGDKVIRFAMVKVAN